MILHRFQVPTVLLSLWVLLIISGSTRPTEKLYSASQLIDQAPPVRPRSSPLRQDAFPVHGWAEILKFAAGESGQEVRRAFLDRARRVAERPVVRRVYRYEDVGKNRTWLDGRSRILEDEIRQTFALAMSDHMTNFVLADELPFLAAAYRLSAEPALKERVLDQLSELAGWSPLQRPGWTLYAPGHRLPPDGKDGNWLATGTGVRAIADTLEMMPEQDVPATLRGRLELLLVREIEGVVDDWKTQRTWFVRSKNPRTNQWVLPTEGLVRACLFLGKDRYRQAYEIGVTNLLESLSAFGNAGEFDEGIQYATFTVTSLLHAARAMAIEGDRRALDHPFLQNFPTWMVHHLQPGRWLINCFDAFNPQVPRSDPNSMEMEEISHIGGMPFRKLLSLIVVSTGSPVANWALREQFAGPSDDLAGLGAALSGSSKKEPPLYAYYDRARRVNWRSSWADNASGVWVRGGHPLDQHDHQDRGHVNYISKGKPILIEAGTPSYDTRDMNTLYASGVGHNVLQLATCFPDDTTDRRADDFARFPGWQKPQGLASLSVRWLSPAGGNILVDGTACYDGLRRWMREVEWNSSALKVNDEVAVTQPEVVLFRWHLGTPANVAIHGIGKRYSISWQDAEMHIESSSPLQLSQQTLPDHTLRAKEWDEFTPNWHTCIVVRSVDKVSELRLRTLVAPRD